MPPLEPPIRHDRRADAERLALCLPARSQDLAGAWGPRPGTQAMNRRGQLLELAEGAARLLAIGEGGVKPRLLAACMQQLQYIHEAEVPAELVPMLASIRRRLGHDAARELRVSVQSALDRMTAAAAVKLAADIFEFNALLSRASYH